MRIEEIESILHPYNQQTGSDEACSLYNIVEAIKPEVIVEIGVADGGSLLLWSKMLDSTGLLVGIDAYDYRKWDITTSKCKTEFVLGNTMQDNTFNKVLSKLNGRKVDFLRIDGGHDYVTVENDYNRYSGLVRDGGIIAFHDNCSSVDVRRFVNRLSTIHNMRFIYCDVFKDNETAYFYKGEV